MNSSKFKKLVNIGYHHAYMANMLQLNEGNSNLYDTEIASRKLSAFAKTGFILNEKGAIVESESIIEVATESAKEIIENEKPPTPKKNRWRSTPMATSTFL